MIIPEKFNGDYKMPLISVVIPLYNKEPHIKRAIDSVLSQKVQDFELIVVDDGSTDKSVEVIRGINDERIKLIQQENAGVSAARNRGIREANADLVAFLDADDEWFSTFLDTIIRLRTQYPNAGLYGTAYEIHFPGSIVQKRYMANKGERLISSYFGAFVEFGGPLFNSSSFVAPKKILIEVGGYPQGIVWGEDSIVWDKIALKFPIAYSPKICSVYHKYSANNSTHITEYLESPFVKYISTIHKSNLLQRDDIKELMEYSDFSRITAISRNIFSGHGRSVKNDLVHVRSKRYIWKKYQLIILSFIPFCLMDIIRKHVELLSYLKWKINKKQELILQYIM